MKRMKNYYMKSAIILAFCFLTIGCKKFLNVVPSTLIVNPSTISDFREMLNSDSLATCNFTFADLMSDDVYMTLFARTESYANAYMWRKNIWTANESDFSYNSAYTRILQLNIILAKLPLVKSKTDAEEKVKRILLAEAKVHRAWYYLQLANIYGQDFTSGLAEDKPATPLILVPAEGEKPSRATIQVVYNQIIKDLQEALATDELAVMGNTIIQPGRAAAHTLLARTYLYMANYEKALEHANAALELKSTLQDYNKLQAYPVTLLDQSKNPEVMMGKVGVEADYERIFIRQIEGDFEFVESLGNNDKRRTLAFEGSYNTFSSNASITTFNYSIAVPEAMLIKAECLARKKDVNAALIEINKLRKNRIENPKDLTATADNILQTVLLERRKELFLHGGLRLFDLKRLNREPALQVTLKRYERDPWTGEILKELSALEPNSPRYLMEIAPKIISINKKIVPNPR